MKIVFVGDEPSKSNISPDIPFVGAKCFPRLITWINRLKPDYYIVLNSDTVGSISDVNKLYKFGFIVIALGQKASQRLTKFGIPHKSLPHPSGLNRKINNKKYIDEQLKKVVE